MQPGIDLISLVRANDRQNFSQGLLFYYLFFQHRAQNLKFGERNEEETTYSQELRIKLYDIASSFRCTHIPGDGFEGALNKVSISCSS